jgi:hypothetical protein
MTPVAVNYLCNLWMGPLSQSVSLLKARKACQEHLPLLIAQLLSYRENEMLYCEYDSTSCIHKF